MTRASETDCYYPFMIHKGASAAGVNVELYAFTPNYLTGTAF